MTTILIFVGLFIVIWMTYELWRAPLLRQDEEGGPFITVRPQRKLRDLFKRKK